MAFYIKFFMTNTHMLMAHSVRLGRALLHIFALSFLDILEISNGSESDIYCLRSIKDSLEDPHNFLKDSWYFNNNTADFICEFVRVECWHPDVNEVLNIQLSHMMLKGHFPRDIEHCTHLTGLDLSANELLGPVPFDIGDLIIPFVIKLDLSGNKFSSAKS
ncbi:probably inactive leucine-rich repeat receptor-like protein kinase At5g48380 [Quercus robur]|uniref:probably inactive leucine-rich repeat receptor-like protein kinase At5g48380 n=1 Tax=Quercus robur TaxID=38942 RepID=UPI0021622122|nr:probably inactive leucine-rich repeat receptor-like protein kinase At5g48380 [Quercus robur]